MSKREYKSNVFSMLMEYPEYALDAYNALAGTAYSDVSLLKIQKLNEGVLLSIRNDASFLIDAFLNLWEHQSSFNPNMPLRFLLYYSNLMWDYIKENELNLYGTKTIVIPTPKFVVFYNGLEERPEKEVFRLSNLYERKMDCYSLDLTCEMYNINPGKNYQLQIKSKVLSGYTIFVEKVRTYEMTEPDLERAVNRAIDECVKEEILAEFFESRRLEVLEMTVLDFTFEKRAQLIARDSHADGVAEGVSQGLSQGLSALVHTLKEFIDTPEEILEKVNENPEYKDITLEEIKNYMEM